MARKQEKSEFITRSELARRLGVSATTITKGINTGRFKTKNVKGKNLLNYRECKLSFLNTRTRSGCKTIGEMNAEKKTERTNGKAIPHYPATGKSKTTDVGGMFDLHDVRLELERAKAMKEKLNLEILQGKHAPVDEIKKEFKHIAETLKKSILAIPDRIGPLVAGESDPHTVRQLLLVELKRSLQTIVINNLQAEQKESN